MPLDDALRAELEEYARSQNQESFRAWVGAENLEMRVGDDWIDQQIVKYARGEA